MYVDKTRADEDKEKMEEEDVNVKERGDKLREMGGVGMRGGVGADGDGGWGSVERRNLCGCATRRISRTYKFMQKNVVDDR